ncbi:MAG TPA: MmcQ/YjbR family DNA-binding protein, partial [Dehalococcoidia bacterium]
WEEVVALAIQLPGVEASTSYGTPSLKVRKKFMSRLREDDVIVLVQVDDIEQRMLMDTQPQTYFKTPHYEGHASILIRLSRADPAEVRELLERTWNRLAGPRLLAQRPSTG